MRMLIGAVLACLFGWGVVPGLMSGKVRISSPGGVVSQVGSPVLFWLAMGINAALVVLGMYLIATAAPA